MRVEVIVVVVTLRRTCMIYVYNIFVQYICMICTIYSFMRVEVMVVTLRRICMIYMYNICL